MKEIGESFKEARETIGISKEEVVKEEPPKEEVVHSNHILFYSLYA